MGLNLSEREIFREVKFYSSTHHLQVFLLIICLPKRPLKSWERGLSFSEKEFWRKERVCEEDFGREMRCLGMKYMFLKRKRVFLVKEEVLERKGEFGSEKERREKWRKRNSD